MILDEDERATSRVLSELHRNGWLDAGVASSPELEPDRLYALSSAGRSEIARAVGISPSVLGQELPVDPQELAYRWARVETTVGLNRFVAELVAAVHRTTNLRVEALRSLPRRRAKWACWPAEVEAYGCLRADESLAPFFIAWDRAAAPFHHRRKRLSAWYAFSKEQQAWGHEVPPILVLCANVNTSAQWANAAQASAERHADRPLPVLLAEIDAVFSADPLDELWRNSETNLEAALTERLNWRGQVPDESHLRALANLPQTASQQVPMRSVLAAADTSERRDPMSYRQLGVMEKRFIDWLAFHPLLTAEDLSLLVHCRRQQAQVVLKRLNEADLTKGIVKRKSDDGCDETYYFLARVGLEILALRDGVPVRRYARYAAIAAAVNGWHGEGRLQTLLRQFDHTVGINQFCVRMVGEAERHGATAIRWLSASDSAARFSRGDAYRWLRPDSIVDLSWHGTTRRYFLEWDRGTERIQQLREKSFTYAAYFSWLSNNGVTEDCLPMLLVVTTSTSREDLVRRTLRSTFQDAEQSPEHCLTSLISLVERYGSCGPVWLPSSANRRQPLLMSEAK
ncbi:MAG: hypothetical protein GEU75_11955 [Dehalococcoidia bacterium]|nr:hypothetical protein [Dehalococcoidia bacterium]